MHLPHSLIWGAGYSARVRKRGHPPHPCWRTGGQFSPESTRRARSLEPRRKCEA